MTLTALLNNTFDSKFVGMIYHSPHISVRDKLLCTMEEDILILFLALVTAGRQIEGCYETLLCLDRSGLRTAT